MAGLSARLRAESGAKFEAIVKHRFTDELAAGTIEKSVLKQYLIQDHRFLDSFVPSPAACLPACVHACVHGMFLSPECTERGAPVHIASVVCCSWCRCRQVVLLSSMIAAAPSLDDRVPGCQAAAQLTSAL